MKSLNHILIFINMKETLSILKALSDETKFKILECLLEGEKCVCEIVPITHRTQSTTSFHLRKLESMGIVSSRREGKRVYYKLSNEKVKKVIEVLKEN